MLSLSGTLHTAYLPADGMGHIPAAGRSTQDGQRAGDCLRWEERPATPERIKRFRTPLCDDPGKIARHPGAARDALPGGTAGCKSTFGESAAQCMQVEPATDISRWQLGKAESIYARWEGWAGASSHPDASRRLLVHHALRPPNMCGGAAAREVARLRGEG